MCTAIHPNDALLKKCAVFVSRFLVSEAPNVKVGVDLLFFPSPPGFLPVFVSADLVFVFFSLCREQYLGIKSLTCLVNVSPAFAVEHQRKVIDCLQSSDDTLKRKVSSSLPLDVPIILFPLQMGLACAAASPCGGYSNSFLSLRSFADRGPAARDDQSL